MDKTVMDEISISFWMTKNKNDYDTINDMSNEVMTNNEGNNAVADAVSSKSTGRGRGREPLYSKSISI